MQEMLSMDDVYEAIAKRLQNEFPEGTVIKSDKSAYIPVQAYMARLEESAKGNWSWRMVGQPVFYEREQQVMVQGILKIVDAERSGVGFSTYTTYTDTGKIQNIKNAINAAESDAIRNACDKYLMGWTDLQDYRKWANNPGVGIKSKKVTMNNESGYHNTVARCLKCQKLLTPQEDKLLREHKIRQYYCENHIPKHLLGK
jgi:hypothetical protein